MRLLFSLALILTLLVGCSRTTLVAAYKLRNVTPETTDLNKLRVAVQIPHQFKFEEKGVTLQMRLGKTPRQSAQIENFILQPDPRAATAPELTAYAKASATIHAFRLAKKDIARFDRLRKLAILSKNGEERDKSMSVGTKLCRTKRQLPKNLPISTFMKFAETGEFIPLTLEMDLFGEIGRADIKKLAPLCPHKKR